MLARGEIVEEATYKLMVAMLALFLYYVGLLVFFGFSFGWIAGISTVVLAMCCGIIAAKVRPLESVMNYFFSISKIVPKGNRLF